MIRMKKRTKKLNSQQFQSDDLIFGDNNNNGDGGGGGGGFHYGTRIIRSYPHEQE